MKHHVFVIFCSFFIFFSCSKEATLPVHDNSYFNYFPLIPGAERIYQVTSIHIDAPTNINDTAIYFLREQVLDTIIDTLDYTIYLISQEKRTSDTLPWQHVQHIAIRKHQRKIVKIEDNMAYTLLQFPASTSITWDGNEYNNKAPEMYSYSDLSANYGHENMILDSVLVVKQSFFESLYTYTFKEEQYAYGIGLCSKTDYVFESQPTHANININMPIKERITYGYLHTYLLISYSIPE